MEQTDDCSGGPVSLLRDDDVGFGDILAATLGGELAGIPFGERMKGQPQGGQFLAVGGAVAAVFDGRV